MTKNIYSQLDDPATPNRRGILKKYLQKLAHQQQIHPAKSEEIAYSIAGLMPTEYIRSLDDQDPYVQIMLLAGILELPAHQHSDATWDDLHKRIAALD